MNLNIRQANATKSYVVTDVCTTRPRIVIKDGNNVSYLPLTTSAKQGFGLRNKVNGVNYRPLEYQSMSTSATYYTTAVASNGLSSTTALTRSSTSQTVYHTCSSTSGTSYLTRSSTSGTSYLTQSGTKYMSLDFGVTYSDSYNVQGSTSLVRILSITATESLYNSYTGSNIDGQYYTSKQTVLKVLMPTNYTANVSYTTQNGQYNKTTAINTYKSLYQFAGYLYFDVNPTTSSQYRLGWSRGNTAFGYFTHLTDSLGNHTFNYSEYSRYSYYGTHSLYTLTMTCTGNLESTQVVTTGTSYLTRSSTSATSYLTRSSTSRTEYKTRESTSGYSGVSSSSSQSSGWL